ncbi:MAG: 23S rRNA (uracil(1939)-C(5))-methyltransferase RlmD [Candidatus Latescibacterota bacterium]
MKRDEELVLEVTGVTADGDGTARIADRPVIVTRAVPGDRVRARVLGRRRGTVLATAEEILSTSMPRREAPCPLFGRCGGCRWQDLRYGDQLALKARMVKAALSRAGLPLPEPEPILGSPTEFFYRNKMEFAFGRSREGEFQLGLHARGSFSRLLNLERCLLQSSRSNDLVAATRRWAETLGLFPYDLRRHEGLLRFLTVRDAKATGACMGNLVVAAYPDAGVDRLTEAVLAELPGVDTWVTTLHRGKAQVAAGESSVTRRGSGTIVERCGEVEYEVSPRSFLQTNTLQAERLYGLVSAWAGEIGGGRVLDLYCGAGGIALQLARRAAAVWGIESVPEAVTDGCCNARRNGIANCTFLSGTVEEVLPGLPETRFELVVVDPPRAGMHERAAQALAALRAPRILYVSCNPLTLAVDLERLGTAGYRVRRLRAVDLFPQTPHCELLVELLLGPPPVSLTVPGAAHIIEQEGPDGGGGEVNQGMV